MTINRKNYDGDSRTVRALMEQVSQIQTDINTLDSQVEGLDNAKVNKSNLEASVTTERLTAGTANIATTTINRTGIATPNGSITVLKSDDADIGQLNADDAVTGNLRTEGLQVTGSETVTNLEAQRINASESIKLTPEGAPSATTLDWYRNEANLIKGRINTSEINATDRVATNTVVADKVMAVEETVNKLDVNQTLNVNDINITGQITGLNDVDINARSITTPLIKADLINAGDIITSDVNHLTPSPSLDNNDHYTVVLPSFTGIMVLNWTDNADNTIWSATVIGNGTDYEIHWGTAGNTLTVTKLYQYDGRLYIRERANGGLYYSYHATKELDAPNIWYNYTALDNVVGETDQHICTGLSGQISFGDFYTPRFTFEDLLVKGNLTVLGDSNLKQTNATGLDVSTTETVIDPETEEETEVKHEHFKADENGITVGFESIKWNGTDVKVCDDFDTDWVKD
jgi:hypothetical protein